MSPVDLVTFAATALVRHRLRSGLSLLGVMIGVAAVVILTALGEGARIYVTTEFASLGSNLLIIMPGRNETTGGSIPGAVGVANDLTLADSRALERELAGVHEIAPVTVGTETVSHRERRRQVTIMGSTASLEAVRELELAQGEFLPEGDIERGGPVALLGASVARELFPAQSAVGQIVRIGQWRMRVVGVLRTTGTQIGMNMDEVAVIPVSTGMRMFNRSSLFRILVKLDPQRDPALACAQAVTILSDRHDENDVTCITQDSVVASLSSILNVLTATLGGIAAVSLSVAGIGIMNLMLVSVSERTAEVGLLKAVGVQDRQILAVFLSEAILLALAGGLLGLAIGQLGIVAIRELYPAFPARSPLWAIWAALATSLAVGALFGVLPARRATRLDPVLALARR